MTRKYYSEFGLSMVSNYSFLLQQDGMPVVDSHDDFSEFPCHIYIICRRPRITLDPNVFEVDSQKIKLRFGFQMKNDIQYYDIDLVNYTEHSSLRLECNYPHTEFKAYSTKEEVISYGKVALLAQQQPLLSHLCKLEVLYIGQAYGNAGSRTASDRLLNHSTLQRIYSEVIRETPDQEVWLTLWNFEQVLVMNFDNSQGPAMVSDEEDEKHTEKVITGAVSEEQRINFTEAALIKYFQPKYNYIFKGTFPSSQHSTYSQCYDLDLNSIMVELNADGLGCKLWSADVSEKLSHLIYFPLHNKDERMSMFKEFVSENEFDV